MTWRETRTRPLKRPVQNMGHKRKRRDRFPGLAASHAPSTSVRRTRRGARLATIPCGTASGRWIASSPLATTILGARPVHAHGPFASNPSTGFPSAAPPREGVRHLAKDDLTRHSRGPSAAFATARNLAAPLSIRCAPLSRTPDFVRRTLFLCTQPIKRGTPPTPVDWRDNEDGLPRTTMEGGASPPDALNPAPL